MYFPDEPVTFSVPQSVLQVLHRAAKVLGEFKWWSSACPVESDWLPVFSALLDLSAYLPVYLPNPKPDYTCDADVWLP